MDKANPPDKSSEFRRERLRRAAEIDALAPIVGTGSPAFVGTVVTASASPGTILKYQPTSVLGTETEGGSFTSTTRCSGSPTPRPSSMLTMKSGR